jgi:hypothetical protein
MPHGQGALDQCAKVIEKDHAGIAKPIRQDPLPMGIG